MLVRITSIPDGKGIAADPLAETQVSGVHIAGLLNYEIRGDADNARNIIAHLDAVESGSEVTWSQSGDAYFVEVNRAGVLLNFHWASLGQSDTASVSLVDLREALKAWISALERQQTSNSADSIFQS